MILTRRELEHYKRVPPSSWTGMEIALQDAVDTALAILEHIDQTNTWLAYNGMPLTRTQGIDSRVADKLGKTPPSLTDLCQNCGGFSQTLRVGQPWTCDDCGAVR